MKIRKAEPDDTSAILGLIRELAVFEKEPNAVHTTEEDFLRDGFQDNPYFQCLVGEVDAEIVGFALYFFCWSTWTGKPSMFLEDLYIKETFRGRGFGKDLLKECARIAVARNCARFEWEVLDWNIGAREFYHDLGARHMQDWLLYRLDGKALKDFANS